MISDTEDTRKLIEKILNNGHLMSLATLDQGGLWVSDVVYVYDDNLSIYWMSNPGARHSKAILENSQVAGSITISNGSKEPNLGLQFYGTAEKIDGPRYDLATKHLAKRSYPEPSVDDDVLEGDSWYVLKPEYIDLINEKLFGYEKKKLKLP